MKGPTLLRFKAKPGPVVIAVVDAHQERGKHTALRLESCGYQCCYASHLEALGAFASCDLIFWELSAESSRDALQTLLDSTTPVVVSTVISALDLHHPYQIERPWLVEQAVESIENALTTKLSRTESAYLQGSTGKDLNLSQEESPLFFSVPDTIRKKTPLGDPEASLDRLWQQSVTHLADDRVQQAFIRACIREQQLSYALDKYQGLNKQYPSDDRVKKYLTQVGTIVTLYALQPQKQGWSSVVPSRGTRLLLMGFIIAALILIVMAWLVSNFARGAS
ncbi:MAG: hypothetical protein KTR25_16280 [Myxococcales bacterium]|nr:hypothetical protein [Myxococcales bacterium]